MQCCLGTHPVKASNGFRVKAQALEFRAVGKDSTPNFHASSLVSCDDSSVLAKNF